MRWILQMAWRDTRTSRSRLLLYTASITLGIAALVLIASLGESLRGAVHDQSNALLGADLVAFSGDGFSPEADEMLASFGGERAREVSFRSMAHFPRTGMSRLVSVRAIEDGFPYYGKFDTNPADAGENFRSGKSALVEESVMLQFDVKPGDEVKVGTETFTIAGALRQVPGETPGFSLVQPRVYIPFRFLEATGVVQRGSELDHRMYLALPPGANAETIRREHRPQLREYGARLESVGSREARTGRVISNIERFLSMVGYIALLLGGVGVASGIHVFIRQKLGSIAVLRCVGATMRQTFAIYLLQASVLGLLGAVAGAMLGVALQWALLSLVGDLLPVSVPLGVSWRAVLQGIAAGVGVTLALALLPLLGVRRVSPLLALRSTIEPPRGSWHDPAVLLVVGLVVLAVTGFAVQQTNEWDHGVGFVAGTLVVFGVLSLIGLGLMRAARWLAPAHAPYVLRQGIANLFRPNNRTLLVILALGLGTFLLVTMQLVQGMLLGQITTSQQASQTNMIFFDIQGDQRAGVRKIIEDAGRPVLRDVPFVLMRIASINGVPADELRQQRREDRWVFSREYRTTYRRELDPGERLVAGTWVPEVSPDTSPVPVSLEEEIAQRLGVTVGDRMVFDVQGVPLESVVGSIRQVERDRIDFWFFMSFPAGVLEAAGQSGAIATHVDDAEQSARVQRAMFEQYPSVSAFDLMMMFELVSDVLDWAALLFRVMALVVVLTGLVVLAGVMASGRFQRLQESVLLRTIGASRVQIARIQLVEYWMLGTLAALAGVLLAWCGAWALGRWIFELDVLPDVLPMLWAWLIVSALTILTGWLSGQRLLNHPPLEVLRQEV